MKTPKDNNDDANRENMRKRVNDLFTGSEPPSYASVREVDAMKARIRELEAELAQQPKEHSAATTSSGETKPDPTHPKSHNVAYQVQANSKSWLPKFLSAPVFPDDEDKTRRTSLLNVILNAEIIVLIITFIPTLLVALKGENRLAELAVITVSALTILLWRSLMWRGQVSVASAGMIILFTLSISGILASGGTIRSAGVIYLPAIVIMATLLISRKAGLVSFVLTGLIGAGLIQGEIFGVLPHPQNSTSVVSNAHILAGLGMTTVLLYLAIRSLEEALSRVRRSEQEVRSFAFTLEQRVADRTHDLELASEVGRSVSEKVGDLTEMLSQSVELIRSRYGLYYTQIYRIDSTGRNLVLRAGTGNAGAQLLQHGHRLAISSTSSNARAASSQRPVLVGDTQKNANFLPNPLLPLTRSELAVPLIANNKVVGVLDMQSEKPEAFSEANLPSFQVLAAQLAIAIQNSELFNQTEEARLAVEEQARRLTSSGWQEFMNAIERSESIGYVFNQNEVLPFEEIQNSQYENTLAIPIRIAGASVGEVQLADEADRKWTTTEMEIVQAAMSRVGQHIENLRLLAQAERYRAEAEQVARRLTREGWESYLKTRKQFMDGYVYDLNKVRLLSANGNGNQAPAVARPIIVREERIGELTVDTVNGTSKEAAQIVAAVAEQLSEHIESLRLLEHAEISRIETQNSQEQYKLAVDGSNDGVWDWDLTTNQVYFSSRWKSMIGYNENELTNGFADFEKLLHPEDHDRVLATVNDYLSGKLDVYDVEFRFLHKDGSYRWIRARGKALRNTDGSPYRMAGSHTDITQRKLDENVLAQRANQLETVATLSSTASTVLDPDKLLQAVVDLTKERFGLYHAHIYLADDSWQTLLMAAGAGEIGRKLVAEEHAIPMNLEQSLVARAAREGRAVIVNDVRGEPGFLPNPLLLETRAEMAVPMIVGDKVIGVFDVQSDRSGGFTKEDANIYTALASQVAVALQNARLYVEQAATVTQLRELDRLKSTFLANMSHELRTPLNSILGFTDVMLEGLDGELTEYMDNDLRLIQKNGQHLLHLINDVLDMAKIESGHMNLHPEKFKIHSILDEVAGITSTLASEKNLALFINEDSDQEIEVYADNTRLRQVMINLVNNSIKFTEKGKIALRASQLDGARVLITVKDTGIGIPSDQLEAIFQEFTQVDTSTTRKVGGTGLGLPISRRLVEMHGGRLWAESTGISGEGSTFFVELPLEARITEVVEKQVK